MKSFHGVKKRPPKFDERFCSQKFLVRGDNVSKILKIRRVNCSAASKAV